MTNATPERVNILNDAAGLIVGQRQEDYGTPEENFERIAGYFNIHFKKNLENNIPATPRQMAEFMVLLKMARTINSPTRDSYVDIGGYAGIAGELAKNETSNKEASVPAEKEASNTTGGTWNGPVTFTINTAQLSEKQIAGAAKDALYWNLSAAASTTVKDFTDAQLRRANDIESAKAAHPSNGAK